MPSALGPSYLKAFSFQGMPSLERCVPLPYGLFLDGGYFLRVVDNLLAMTYEALVEDCSGYLSGIWATLLQSLFEDIRGRDP